MKQMKKLAVLMLAMSVLFQSFTAAASTDGESETSLETAFVSEESTEGAAEECDQQTAAATESSVESIEINAEETDSTEATEVEMEELDTYETNSPVVSYSVHMQSYGWLDAVEDGAEAGLAGAGKRLEAIKVQVSGVEDLGISYKVFCDVDGWKSACTDGAVAGTVGESKRIEAVSMELTGTAADQYEVYYRVYVNEYGWLDWSWRGNIVGSDHSHGKSVEAIQIKVQKKGTAAPGSMAHPFLAVGDVSLGGEISNAWLSYTSYIDGSWTAEVSGGKDSGSANSSNLIEAVKINLNQSEYAGSDIQYCVQMQTYGWLDYVSGGEISGKTGSGKRIEAIQIKLTGEIAEVCDIYYRACVESYGWLDWAKNGATAGSVELKKKMLAYQVVLVENNGEAPGATDRPAIYGTGDNAEEFVNTHVNTGNQIQDLIAVAKTQLGYYQPEGTATKYGTWYNTYVGASGDYYPSAPWCAMFVSWCAEQAGIPKTIFRRHSSTVNMASWYQNENNPGSWHDREGYTPKAGDLIFFDFGTNNNFVNHVGIVTSVSGTKVYTIEGNTSDSVKSREYDLNYSCIVGYATPAYEGEENGEEEPVQKMKISYAANVEGSGWGDWVSDGAQAGTTGSAKRLQAVKILVSGNEAAGGVTYRTHMQTYGWGDWVSDGTVSGIADGEKRMEAIEIRLTGELAEKYDVYYRVHSQTYGWLDWAKNGAPAGTEGYAKRVEAIEICLVEKGGTAPGKTDIAFVKKPASVLYSTHVQTYGWLEQVSNGAVSGTEGQAKRLEAIKINLSDVSGSISYRTHVQTYGWLDWVSDGTVSGTTGQAKRLEAVQIELTGQAAEEYDIYYRVHCQTYGWMGWAKNGEEAGTAGLAKRLEAIEIILVPKGGSAPGSTANRYIEG